MFGYTREEALAGLMAAGLYAPARLGGMDFDTIAAPLYSGAKVVEGDWDFMRKDGSRFVGHLRLSLRSAPSGEALGFLGVIEDVSQARKTEEALRAALRHEHEAVERLAALDRSKNDFISSVSHELRTPITSVIGYTDLMRAYDLPEEQLRLLEPVVRNARRLEQLIEDLLTLSRMDGGTFAYRPALMDLRDPVRSAVESVLVAFGQRRVEVIADLGDSPITMMGDGSQIERAVTNLVSNAIKFTPDGGRVGIEVGVDGQTAVITVEDTGIGIPKAEQGKVFDRFFRSSSSAFLAIDGTGLGLHIVNQVVTAHGGRVSFESEEGSGSTFTVRLPFAQS
jgi:PAS domain S-box-containing protein